jgi:hypothetical protein
VESIFGIIVLVVGAIALVGLWVRVRALEALAAEESALRVEATARAIATLSERLQPVSHEDVRQVAGVKKRRRKRRGRRRS